MDTLNEPVTEVANAGAIPTHYQSPAFQSIVLDNMTEGVSVADELGIIVYTNRTQDQMFGYDKDELLGQHVSVFNAYPEAENLQKMQEVIGILQAHGRWEGEFHNRRKDGSTFFTAAKIARMTQQGQVHFVCVQRDITVEKRELDARLRREDALRQSEERLRLATEAGAIGIWDWDVSADKVSWSERVYEIVGVPHGHFGGTAGEFFSIVYPDDVSELTRTFEEAMAHSDTYASQFRIVQPDGTVRWVCNLAKIYRDGAGRPVRVVGTITDITDRKQAEDTLSRASRNKDEFLAMLAHELRNPLAPISAAAQLIELGEPDSMRLSKVARVINRQVKHMVELVDDLLDVSRVTRGLISISRDPQDINSIVATALEQVAPAIAAAGHALSVEFGGQAKGTAPGEAEYVLGDRKRLVQILTNILANAAKYTPAGGHIRLSVDVDASEVILAVEDDGQGIELEMQQQIFELFAQVQRSSDRSQGGLGIGLALVKSLVELHGGTVRCSSQGIGKGSRFQVKLPRAPGAGQNTPVCQPDRQVCLGAAKLRILVADDNVDAASMLAMLLEESGHHVLVEHDSRQALARARSEAPQVCLLDIGLPGMDGYALAQRLRALPETAGAMLIAVTGYGQEHDREKAMSAGFDHHLPKPLDTARLAPILSTLTLQSAPAP